MALRDSDITITQEVCKQEVRISPSQHFLPYYSTL